MKEWPQLAARLPCSLARRCLTQSAILLSSDRISAPMGCGTARSASSIPQALLGALLRPVVDHLLLLTGLASRTKFAFCVACFQAPRPLPSAGTSNNGSELYLERSLMAPLLLRPLPPRDSSPAFAPENARRPMPLRKAAPASRAFETGAHRRIGCVVAPHRRAQTLLGDFPNKTNHRYQPLTSLS